jgi:hypothetical protein
VEAVLRLRALRGHPPGGVWEHALSAPEAVVPAVRAHWEAPPAVAGQEVARARRVQEQAPIPQALVGQAQRCPLA